LAALKVVSEGGLKRFREGHQPVHQPHRSRGLRKRFPCVQERRPG
jgi:hypothetical protein